MSERRLQVVYRATADLVPYARNVKLHPEAQVAQIAGSVREFDFTQPVLVDADGTILAGHGRVLAAQKLGMEQLPTITIGWLSEAQKRAYRIADNRIGQNSGYDVELLAIELQDLANVSFDLPLTGFPDAEIEEILKSAQGPAPDVVEDEVPDLPAVPITKPGDVWLLGDSVLVCGDCTKDVARFLEGGAKLLITDPPYGVSYANKNAFLNAYDEGNRNQVEIENDHQTPGDMSALWSAAFSRASRVLAPGSAYYVTGPQGGELLLLLLQALNQSGLPLRHMLIWAKNQFVLGRSDYHYQHEPILYGWTEGAAHKAVEARGESSLWQIDKPRKSDLHPTMKPVELYARAMRNSSERGGIVYEPFAGSGTAYAAAAQLERVVWGIELAPAYCDVIVERWQNLTGLKARRDPSGS